MKTKFKNKSGDLSFYAFLCGYVQREETERMRKELFLEHSAFHVKVYRLKDGLFSDVIVWNTFESLTEARKNYRSFKLH
jgi:hypothetical protein